MLSRRPSYSWLTIAISKISTAQFGRFLKTLLHALVRPNNATLTIGGRMDKAET